MIRRIDSRALLVRSVPFGESDIIATFFTREAGILGAAVRGARRSQKRFGGALEPIHELFIGLDDKGKDLCFLKEARIERPRAGITASLEAMEAAGEALRWTRHLCAPRNPEPAVWRALEELFDALETPERDGRSALAAFGLRLLTEMGYALELDQCVRCGRACPKGRSAFLDGARGGLVCTSCGGARRTMKPELRSLAVRAQRGDVIDFARGDANEIVEILKEAMAAHAGFEVV